MISSTGNRLRLDLALPHLTVESGSTTTTTELSELGNFVTAAEFRELEKANVTAALVHTGWKTWGPGGAAALLGIKPSTLAYQMKVLGIKKIGRR